MRPTSTANECRVRCTCLHGVMSCERHSCRSVSCAIDGTRLDRPLRLAGSPDSVARLPLCFVVDAIAGEQGRKAPGTTRAGPCCASSFARLTVVHPFSQLGRTG